MKKRILKIPVSLLLTLLLIAVGLPSVWADDYTERARQHVAEVLDVSPDMVFVEGSVQEYEYTGRTLWVGRYMIGGSTDGEEGQTDALPPTETKEGGDAGASGKPAPDRMASEPYDPSGERYGMVIIDVNTDELYIDDAAWVIMEEEQLLWQNEWERLRQEAGVIDVDLYRKLKDAAAEATFTVILQPRFTETEAMRQAVEVIYQDYEDLFDTVDGDGVIGFAQDKDAAIKAESAAMTEPAPVDSAGSDGAPDMIIDPIWYERYEEMYARLDEVWRQGFTDSLAQLEAALQNMNVNFSLAEEQMTAVQADMTAGQILSLKSADFLDGIYEEGQYMVMSDMEEVSDIFRTGAISDGRMAAAALKEMDESSAVFPWWGYGLAGIFLIAVCGGWMIVRKKGNANT